MPPALTPGREAKRHIEEARDNYQRYQRLLASPEDKGWASVALFYAALHLVQSHAVAKSRADARVLLPQSHAQRDAYIANHCLAIDFDYAALQELSLSVRYLLYKPDEAEIIQLHDAHFVPILTYFKRRGFGW